MEECPDPLAVVSPESSNQRVIGSIRPRIVKTIGAPAPGQAKNAENKKGVVVSLRPVRLRVIPKKACQSVPVSPRCTPPFPNVLLSKETLDSRLINPSGVKALENQTPPVASASPVYLRKNRKCDREPLSITEQNKKAEVHVFTKSGVPRNTSLQRIVKCNYCDYQTERPAMMRSHVRIDHKKLHGLQEVGLGYTVRFVERNNKIDEKNEHSENLDYIPRKQKKSKETKIHCCKLCDFETVKLDYIKNHLKGKHKLIESRSEGDLYEYRGDFEASIILLPPGDPGFKIRNERGMILKYTPRKRKKIKLSTDTYNVPRNRNYRRNIKCNYCELVAERITSMQSHIEKDHSELHKGGLGYTVRYVENKRYEMPPVVNLDERKEVAVLKDKALVNNPIDENQKSCEDDLIMKSEEIIKEEPVDHDLVSMVKEESGDDLKFTLEEDEYLLEAELMEEEEEPDPLSMDQTPEYVSSGETRSEVGSGFKECQGQEESRSRAPSRENVTHNAIYLWEFFLKLLEMPELYQKEIAWVDKEEGVFRIGDTKGVARLWGRHKNKPNMTFATVGRAIGYYRQNGIFVKTQKRCPALVYQFADTTMLKL